MAIKEDLKKTTLKIFSLVGLNVELEVEEKDEPEKLVLSLRCETPAKIIGYHGRTLDSLEQILKIILYRTSGRWWDLEVDVDGYLEKRKKILEKMASLAAVKAKATGKPVSLPFLPAKERKIVHLYLSKIEGVTSESEGEGKERRLIVKSGQITA